MTRWLLLVAWCFGVAWLLWSRSASAADAEKDVVLYLSRGRLPAPRHVCVVGGRSKDDLPVFNHLVGEETLPANAGGDFQIRLQKVAKVRDELKAAAGDPQEKLCSSRPKLESLKDTKASVACYSSADATTRKGILILEASAGAPLDALQVIPTGDDAVRVRLRVHDQKQLETLTLNVVGGNFERTASRPLGDFTHEIALEPSCREQRISLPVVHPRTVVVKSGNDVIPCDGCGERSPAVLRMPSARLRESGNLTIEVLEGKSAVQVLGATWTKEAPETIATQTSQVLFRWRDACSADAKSMADCPSARLAKGQGECEVKRLHGGACVYSCEVGRAVPQRLEPWCRTQRSTRTIWVPPEFPMDVELTRGASLWRATVTSPYALVEARAPVDVPIRFVPPARAPPKELCTCGGGKCDEKEQERFIEQCTRLCEERPEKPVAELTPLKAFEIGQCGCLPLERTYAILDEMDVEAAGGQRQTFSFLRREMVREPGESCDVSVRYTYKTALQTYQEGYAPLVQGAFQVSPPDDTLWRYWGIAGIAAGGGLTLEDRARGVIAGEVAAQFRFPSAPALFELPLARYTFGTHVYLRPGDEEGKRFVYYNRAFFIPRGGVQFWRLQFLGGVGIAVGWPLEGEDQSLKLIGGPVPSFASEIALRLMFTKYVGFELDGTLVYPETVRTVSGEDAPSSKVEKTEERAFGILTLGPRFALPL